MPTHRPRARSDPDQRIILAVLQRIDRVIADHPRDRPAIERREHRPVIIAQLTPADQRAPAEHQSEPRLRPPRDALHERIGGDRQQAAKRDQLRLPAQLQQHCKPDATQQQQPYRRRLAAHPPARHRPRGGARHPPVQIGIDHIVIDAARAAHRDRPEQQPAEQRPAPFPAGEQHAPGARPVQQPPADRPVEPGELGIVAQPGREPGDETAMLAVGDDMGGHRAGE